LKRGSCSSLIVTSNGYEGEESSCNFLEVQRIKNGIEAFVDCDDGHGQHSSERVTLQIFRNRLKFENSAL
jgi:hypothetical protein